MCTEMQNSIVKVHRNYRRLTATQKAKSVIIKLKQWVKKFKTVDGGGVKLARNSDQVIDRQNLSNENKFNIVKSKMAYTVEELRDIVDDNLANELREIEATRTTQE